MGWIDAIKQTVNAIGLDDDDFGQKFSNANKMIGAGIRGGMPGAKKAAANRPSSFGAGSSSRFPGQGALKSGINDQSQLNKFAWQQPENSGVQRMEQSRFSGQGALADESQMYQSIIDELMGKINQEYAYDGAGDALVDQAFQGSLDALGNARTRTNDNFAASSGNIDTLTKSHVANITGADRNAVMANSDRLESGIGDIYGAAQKSYEGDREKEMALKTEMLSRLGIQDAGIGTVGEVQTEAIADNTAEQAGAMKQAAGYEAADLTRNTEQAQSMSAAGVERQTDLRRQLDGILGGLDTQEANIRNDMSSAKLNARQADQANFQKQQSYYQDSLEAFLNDQSNRAESERDFNYKASLDQAKLQGRGGGEEGGGNNVFSAIDQSIASQGIDPAPYRAAYNQAMADGGGPLSGDLGSETSHMYKRMREIMAANGQKADLNIIGNYVNGVQNFGTDKFNN